MFFFNFENKKRNPICNSIANHSAQNKKAGKINSTEESDWWVEGK